MDGTHPAADLDRVAVKPVGLAADAEADVLADPGLYGGLDGLGVGDIADDRAAGALLEQLGQNRCAVARRTGPAAVGQIAQNDRTGLGRHRLADGLFDRHHIGMKGLPLGPARRFDLLGDILGQVGLAVGGDHDTHARLGNL